jgi:hypothetical protein
MTMMVLKYFEKWAKCLIFLTSGDEFQNSLKFRRWTKYLVLASGDEFQNNSEFRRSSVSVLSLRKPNNSQYRVQVQERSTYLLMVILHLVGHASSTIFDITLLRVLSPVQHLSAEW